MGSSTEKLVVSVPVNLGDERLKALRPSKFQQNMATLLEVNFILDLDEAERRRHSQLELGKIVRRLVRNSRAPVRERGNFTNARDGLKSSRGRQMHGLIVQLYK